MNIKSKIKYMIAGAVIAIFSSLFFVAGLFAVAGVTPERVLQAARLFVAMRFVESRYVEDVDSEKLTNGAISGMIHSLGDPYSAYLDREMYRRTKEHTEGTFGGIGVVMGFNEGAPRVITVMNDTPGEASGLKPGDVIIAVDGRPTSEMESSEVALAIRGEVGTNVTLTIGRENEEDQDYVITRDHIHVTTAAGKMIDDRVGYIKIVSFSEGTAKEFHDAYNSLIKEGMKGLVIDLRANPGGLLNSCVDIARELVPKGTIVSVVQRDGTRQEYSSDLPSAPLPMVVIINKDSASASEILSGALKDTGAAKIVGTKSYGKGSVQVIMPIPGEDDAVKLTIAKYYTPSGESIDGKGVIPDIELQADPSDTSDMQLKKAVEILEESI